MKTKKPDRFEREVDDCHFNDRSDAADAVKLLRREHRWMVRMITKLQAESWGIQAPDMVVNGYQQGLEAILDRLTQRAR